MNFVVTQIARPEQNKVPQMQGGSNRVDEAMVVYIKNAIVSLASAKMYNPDARCILNCNFGVPDDLRSIANIAGIEIHFLQGGQHRSCEEYIWSVTQYKFDSLAYAIELMDEDDCMIQLDTDTLCVQSLADVYEEANDGLLLYTIDHGYHEPHRERFRRNYQRLYGEEARNLVHYGGEFYGGNKYYLEKLLHACESVIAQTRVTPDLEPWCDEEIVSIAVERYMKQDIYQAGAYISRYWTNEFYLVSTNYCYNAVKIWHLPAEKMYGMIFLFEYYVKNKSFPSIAKIASIMGLPKAKYQKWNPYRWKMRIRNKLKK